MGATDFYHTAKGKTAKEAFSAAIREASHEHGHGGYTGTIAEKDSFVLIAVPASFVAENRAGESREDQYAYKLIRDADPRVDDKWGPAGCIDCGGGAFLFFGIASC